MIPNKKFILWISLFWAAWMAWPAAAVVFAAHSTITEADGYACMGDDKSRKQTEAEALANAKRKAAEYAVSYIRSETAVKDFQLEKDLIESYANATVKIIQELDKSWYKDDSMGDCHRVKVKAEVVPDDRALSKSSKEEAAADPSGPLQVRVWTDKKEYRQSERIKIYVRGNKPFYARLLYRDTKGSLLQLLPNPYRSDHYFHGGVIYEIPSGNDHFDMEVNPPFGPESIILYASTSPLGEIGLEDVGVFYQVTTGEKDVGKKTRGVKIKKAGEPQKKGVSEFFEATFSVNTKRQ